MPKAMPAVTESSGNVFADLGLPNPDLLLAKAMFVAAIERTIKARKLTQTAAAAAMGLKQPDLSRLLRGHTEKYSLDRLIRLLNALGQDVKIEIAPAPRRRRGEIKIAA